MSVRDNLTSAVGSMIGQLLTKQGRRKRSGGTRLNLRDARLWVIVALYLALMILEHLQPSSSIVGSVPETSLQPGKAPTVVCRTCLP
jgi:hypothetical protein